MIDNDLKQAMAGLLDGEPTQGVDVDRALDAGRSARRGRRIKVALSGAVAAVVVVVGVSMASSALVDKADVVPVITPSPSPSPGLVVGDVPVWYDAIGLHRGDVVEQTPVQIGELHGEDMGGALTLVRSGALYLDPATGDVWFHPWGGTPRIVGHNSAAGPGGDPNGDTAAWFEGSDAQSAGPGELVVYDTADGHEISRTVELHGVADCSGICGEYYPAGNGFLQVSADRVVWHTLGYGQYGQDMYSHDLATQKTSAVETWIEAPDARFRVDVHDQVEALGEAGDSAALVVSVPGRTEVRYPGLGPHSRLSASGDYVLAPGGRSATIIDTRTGDLWPVPKNGYPWIAWSYGDIALVDTEDALLACDAARHTCERLRAKRPFLMPTT